MPQSWKSMCDFPTDLSQIAQIAQIFFTERN